MKKLFFTLILCFSELSMANTIVLVCEVVVKESGSKFTTATKKDKIVLEINTDTASVSGGLTSVIKEAEKFKSEIKETEIQGFGVGKIELLPGIILTNGFYKINRLTGKYEARTSLIFDKGDWRDSTEEGECRPASQKIF